MTRTFLTSSIGVFLAITGVAMAQQHRIFIQEVGVNPDGVPPEGVTIVASGGDTITFDAYIEYAPPGQRSVGCIVAMPCSATEGTAGSIIFSPPLPEPDVIRADYFLPPNSRLCRFQPNIGMACMTEADCIDTPSADCVAGASAPIMDDGNCSSGTVPRVAAQLLPNTPALVLTTPRYVGTISYFVSPDAEGSFAIALVDELCRSFDQDGNLIPFIASGATIVIPTAQCCSGSTCLGDQPRTVCGNNGGFWNPNRTCADSCACLSTVECDDADVCTFESCSGACAGQVVRYGDVNGSGGQVDLDDILCINNGFANITNCPNADIFPPCTGNDIINLDDILKVVAAFGGFDPCGCNP